MKKTIIASAIALAAISGVANAAGNADAGTFDLNFTGTVSTTTCAIEPSVNGITGKNDIALGQTDKNQPGAEIDVVFKPTAASAAACGGAQSNFVMQWSGVGSSFETGGLKAKAGSLASDSHVQIKAVNAVANNNTVTTVEKTQYEFDKAKVTTDGLQYKVNLLGGTEVGDMSATAQVNHWYK